VLGAWELTSQKFDSASVKFILDVGSHTLNFRSFLHSWPFVCVPLIFFPRDNYNACSGASGCLPRPLCLSTLRASCCTNACADSLSCVQAVKFVIVSSPLLDLRRGAIGFGAAWRDGCDQSRSGRQGAVSWDAGGGSSPYRSREEFPQEGSCSLGLGQGD